MSLYLHTDRGGSTPVDLSVHDPKFRLQGPIGFGPKRPLIGGIFRLGRRFRDLHEGLPLGCRIPLGMVRFLGLGVKITEIPINDLAVNVPVHRIGDALRGYTQHAPVLVEIGIIIALLGQGEVQLTIVVLTLEVIVVVGVDGIAAGDLRLLARGEGVPDPAQSAGVVLVSAAGGDLLGKVSVVSDIVPLDAVGVIIAAHAVFQGVDRSGLLHEEVHDLVAGQEGLVLQQGRGGSAGQGPDKGTHVMVIPGKLDGLGVMAGNLVQRNDIIYLDLEKVSGGLVELIHLFQFLQQVLRQVQLPGLLCAAALILGVFGTDLLRQAQVVILDAVLQVLVLIVHHL